jgi:hypothetical protein
MNINSEFDFNQDVIDSRDFYERFEELEAIYDNFENDSEIKNWSDLEEFTQLKELIEELDSYGGDNCSDGIFLISESYFTDYCKEMLEDCGDIPRDMHWYIAIDWEETADNLRADYTEVEINGTTYLYR